jgi:dihydroflavonol-4-reductase
MAHVLVTGGSGFIGGWSILTLLTAGHSVRTTVRNLHREPQLRDELHAAVAFDDARLDVVAADLQSDDGWAAAMDSIDYVWHVASPTLRTAPTHEDDLIVPARDGVLRVLRAARDAQVRRVVLTSAFGAISYGHPPQTTSFTEEDWTNVDADIAPYQKSKTLAERAAWQFIEEEGNGLELVAIQPTGVLGPMLGNDDPPSLRVVAAMLDGSAPVCPPFGTGYVDVRDVADLHLRAMTDPAAVGQRFLATAGHALRIVDIARVLHDRLGDRAAKVPTREIPVWAARLLSIVNPALRQLRPQLGKNLDATSAKAERVLGWHARPIEDTITDTAESILSHRPVTAA